MGLLEAGFEVEHAHYSFWKLSLHDWLKALLAGKITPSRPYDELIRQFLCTEEPPLYMSPGQVYEITHVAFYFGAFGRRSALSASEGARAARLLDAIAAKVLALEDPDLAAEVVMAAKSLGLPFGPNVSMLPDYLRHVFESFGLTWSADLEVEADPNSRDVRTRFGEEFYHLVLVYGMMLAMIADRDDGVGALPGAPPSARTALLERVTVAARRGREWLEQSGERESPSAPSDIWAQAISELPPTVSAWLSTLDPSSRVVRTLAMDVLATRMALDYRVPEVARILEAARAQGLPLSWTQETALEWVLLQQCDDGGFAGNADMTEGSLVYGQSRRVTAHVVRSLGQLVESKAWK